MLCHSVSPTLQLQSTRPFFRLPSRSLRQSSHSTRLASTCQVRREHHLDLNKSLPCRPDLSPPRVVAHLARHYQWSGRTLLPTRYRLSALSSPQSSPICLPSFSRIALGKRLLRVKDSVRIIPPSLPTTPSAILHQQRIHPSGLNAVFRAVAPALHAHSMVSNQKTPPTCQAATDKTQLNLPKSSTRALSALASLPTLNTTSPVADPVLLRSCLRLCFLAAYKHCKVLSLTTAPLPGQDALTSRRSSDRLHRISLTFLATLLLRQLMVTCELWAWT